MVLTPPVQQSLELISAGRIELASDSHDALTSISYAPCIALIGRSDERIELPEPGVLRRANENVEWIADNTRKGVSEAGQAITIHCGEGFSREHYDESDEMIYDRICRDLDGVIRADFSAWQIKRWRYARPDAPRTIGIWTDGLPEGLILAGDAFAGARVEGAVLSGLAAAEAIIARDGRS